MNLLAMLLLSAASGVAAETGRVVSLPPFIVDHTAPPRPWRYASFPGVEVLSSCEDGVTRELVQNFRRAHALVQLILPDEFRVRFDAPQALILYDDELWPLAAREAMANALRADFDGAAAGSSSIPLSGRRTELQPTAALTRAGRRAGTASRQVEFMRNMTLFDLDSAATFILVSPRDAQLSRPYLAPEYLEALMMHRAPALPTWFVRGFFGLYGTVVLRDSSLEAPALVWPAPSAAATRKLLRPLLPLRELFADRQADEDARSSEQQVTWLAQAELFVRWGIHPEGGARRDAFWRFVESCAKQPASEELFRECFGFDFVRGEQELAAFLLLATRTGATWRGENSGGDPLGMRDATLGEVARIKGEWERLEIIFVRNELPDLEPKYAAQARRTLWRGYEQAERDPRLLTSLGYWELDHGNRRAGQALLAQAAEAGVIRPRAYLRLAALRLSEERSGSTRPSLKIGREQADAVLDILASALRQAPPLLESYRLVAQVWESCADAPGDSDFAVLDEGLGLFPRSAELAYRTAKLKAAHGRLAEAITRIERAQQMGAEDNFSERLEQLRRELTGREQAR